MIPMPARA